MIVSFTPNLPLAMIEDAVAGGFGVTAAVLLVGGSVMLRWQRSRQQFLLAQTALLQGLKPINSGPPPWIATLRQGVTAIALGMGLIVVGAIAYLMGASVPAPKPEIAPAGQVVADHAANDANARPQQQPTGNRRLPQGELGHPPRGQWQPGDPLPPDQQGRDPADRNPGGRNLNDRNLGPPDPQDRAHLAGPPEDAARDPRGENPPRPRFNGASVDRWRFGQSEQTVGLLAIGSGIVLFLLGVVQVGFAGVERRHSPLPSSLPELKSDLEGDAPV